MGTWNNAAAHGRTAAVNMMGGRQVYAEVPYYTSTMFESQMAAIGTTPDVRPDLETISWADLDARLYRRLFFLEGRLAGAVLIGDIRVRRRADGDHQEPGRDRAGGAGEAAGRSRIAPRSDARESADRPGRRDHLL